MNRTRTSIALATAAMCATVLVSNAGAETSAPAPATGNIVTVTKTTTITPTSTTSVPYQRPTPTSATPTTTGPKSDTRSILQAFSSRDFSDVSTPAVILFVISIIAALLNAAMRIDPAQVDAVINQVRSQLPF